MTLFLQLLASFQCLLFAAFLLTRRNLVPAALFALLGTHIATDFVQAAGLLPEGLTVVHLAGLLYGPLFFSYVRSRTPDALHVAPFALALLAFAGGTLSEDVLALTTFLSLGGYLLASIRAATTAWHRAVTLGLGVIVAFDILSYATQAGAPLFAVLLAYVTSFVFAALLRPRIFTVRATPDSSELAKLDEVMTRERLFLRPELTVADVAAAAGMPARRVSEVINAGGSNVTEWINGYRIAEAKRLLREDGEATVLDVVYASGFQSKSTFNAVFKEATGLTPSAFRRT